VACGGGERLSERRRNEEQKRARGDKGFWALGRRTEAIRVSGHWAGGQRRMEGRRVAVTTKKALKDSLF